MKFPFQHMHWVQHKRHNRKFNLKLIYWWNVIRSPTKTNKSTWHWEKDQLVRMKVTNITIHRWRKSYTNWSTSAKPEQNAPSTILQSKIKSFEVEMLTCANIYSFHYKKFWIFDDETLPWPNASLCQKSRGCTQRPFLLWSDSSCTQGSRICVLFTYVPESIADLFLNTQWGPIFWVAVSYYKPCSLFMDASLEKSECPRKQFTRYSLWNQRHETLDLFEEPLLSQSLQPTLERWF